MAFDPDQVTPCGLTYAQIDAKQARYVERANGALVELRDRGGRWWIYSVSHCTFELLVGEPHGPDNLVIWLGDCESIAGPVRWPDQRLRVTWHNGRESGQGWTYVLEDETVGFKAVGEVFGWQRGYDLLKHGSLSMLRKGLDAGWPAEPSR